MSNIARPTPDQQTIDTDLFLSRLEGSLAAVGSLRESVDELAALARLVISTLEAGGIIYTAGNGGSAAHALHLAEELIGRYRGNRQPLRAVCLNADTTALTCIANDFGYEQVFARQCEAMLTPADLLVVLSTSGNSPNLVEALRCARRRGVATAGILGGRGGACLQLCDAAVVVAGDAPPAGSTDSAFVQEAHQVVVHLVCEAVERAFG